MSIILMFRQLRPRICFEKIAVPRFGFIKLQCTTTKFSTNFIWTIAIEYSPELQFFFNCRSICYSRRKFGIQHMRMKHHRQSLKKRKTTKWRVEFKNLVQGKFCCFWQIKIWCYSPFNQKFTIPHILQSQPIIKFLAK